jgi:uncharacterized LabA/DUF88 family protein
MPYRYSSARVGVYVDVSNMYMNGGARMRYEVLREFACRGDAEPVRLNAYVSYDAERASHDLAYRDGARSFHSALRDIGFKVIVKDIKWYTDEAGIRYGKADTDLDLGVDALLQSESLDRVLIASGDGDFVKVIQALQNRGCRVEVVALDNSSHELREEADLFISGYLIPNLVQVEGENTTPGIEGKNTIPWGEIGSRVRGWCYWHHASQSYGFIRFLRMITPELWLTDTRHPDSPYATAFFHDSELPPEVRQNALPSRTHILEFTLTQADRGLQAIDMRQVSK